jgi:hypothetical protein
MNIKQGEIVTLQHYTSKDFCKGIVVNSSNSNLCVKPQRDCTVFSYFTYDPLVLGIGAIDEIYMLECTITGINYNDSSVDLKIDNTYSLFNKRTDERYPTSIYGVIVHSPIKGSVYIKNMSPDGMSIKSKLDLKEGSNFEIEAYINKILLSVSSEIIWKKTTSNDYEYGLKIKPTSSSKDLINKYISTISNEQMNIIKSMQGSLDDLSSIKTKSLRK